jgi:ribonuclease HII
MVLGIDEAGRGPALGALVIAAVALDPRGARRLRRAGVDDSKRFGAGERARAIRAELVQLVEQTAAWVGIEVCDVEVVDAYASAGRLNVLERERAAALIRRAPESKRIIADGTKVFGLLRAEFPKLEARDRAESFHVAVAAASLCAKVRRDELFACVSARYAPMFGCLEGAGYANDGTRAFAEAYRGTFGALPPEARVSWPWDGQPSVHRVEPAEALGVRAPVRQLAFF